MDTPQEESSGRSAGLAHDQAEIEREQLLKAQNIIGHRQAKLVQAHLAAIVQSSNEAILSKDLDGMVLSWNEAAERLYGYTAAEMLGHSVTVIFPPERLDEFAQIMEWLKQGDPIEHYETERLRKDGSRVPVSLTLSPITNSEGMVVAASTISRDITERRKAEESLRHTRDDLEATVERRTRELAEQNERLQAEITERRRSEQARQQLLQQLVNAQEEERRRISRELHDSLGGYITALHLSLKLAQENAPLDLADRLSELRDLALRIDEAVNHLARELRPPELDDLGLEAALRLLAKEWSAMSHIEVDVYMRGIDHDRLSELVETTVYRIVQEALTNVLRHAQAAHVSLIVERRQQEVLVIVEDDGRGFDPAQIAHTLGKQQPLGIKGIQERLTQVDGQLDIETALGAGTTLYVHVPFPL